VSVPLSLQGEAFYYRNVGAVPMTCSSANVAFPIRNPGNNHWIANGSVITSP